MNAMFNSSGGTIYLGIDEVKRDEVWKVEQGIDLDEKAQDRIQKCVYRIFGHFHPGIPRHADAYEVEFIPVSEGKVRIAIQIDSSARLQGVYHFISDDKSVAYERIGTSCEQVRSSIIAKHAPGSDMVKAAIDANLISHIRSIYNVIQSNLKNKNQSQRLSKLLEPVYTYIMFDQPRLPVKSTMIYVSLEIMHMTRHGLSKDVIYMIKSCLDELIDPFLQQCFDELDINSKQRLSECYFVMAYDGIKYRGSSRIFQMGVPRLGLLAPYLKCAQKKYEDLFDTVNELSLRTPNRRVYTQYLKLIEEYFKIRFESGGSRKPRTKRAEEIEDLLFNMRMSWS
jgi:hypothetical protein